jgi:uroporphyrinogen-III decarboxylase
MSNSPSELYQARLKRFNDAVSLQKPDRVPIASLAAFFMTSYAGLTKQEAMYDYQRMADAWLESSKRLNWDLAAPSFQIWPGRALEIMGCKQFRWPGHSLPNDLTYQWVESEYMLADEYDEFLRNPGDFTFRKLWPRMGSAFEPFGMFPPLHWMSSSYTMMIFGAIPGAPPVAEAFQRLVEYGQDIGKWVGIQGKLMQDLEAAGYPILTFAFAEAPFDWVTDMLRGLKGIMLDMYRQPDKLLAAIDLFTDMQIQVALGGAQQSGNPRVFIPLHRGAGGFMSEQQFERFYWPSLNKLILAIIDAGLTPMPFWEGDYTPRLKYLAELPKGKVAGHFDIVDLQKCKEILGDTMCFWGNVPAQLLVTGTAEQVKDYVKKLIDTFGDNGGLIVDGAVQGVPDESRPELVEAMTEAVFEYGVYK